MSGVSLYAAKRVTLSLVTLAPSGNSSGATLFNPFLLPNGTFVIRLLRKYKEE